MFKNLNVEALGVSGRPSEIIELALSNGFKGFDLDLVDFAEQVRTHGLAHARRLLDSARLKIGGFRLPVAWQDDPAEYKRDMENLPKLAELAQQMGAERAIATIEPAGDTRPYHENFEFHRRRLAEMAAALAPFKIRLGIEFLSPASLRQGRAFQFIQTCDAVLTLLRTIAAANLGLVLDLWHWHVGGGTLDQVRTLGGEKIVAVYLADAEPGTTAANADETTRRLPGETGVINAAEALAALAELHYDGPVTPRPHPARMAGLSRDKIVKQASASIDQVWKAAGLSPAGLRPRTGSQTVAGG